MQWAAKYKTTLDLGAGLGRHSILLDELGMKVTAADISKSSIDIINSYNKNIETHACDMTNLPFEDQAFDCVVCFHAIYHTTLEGIKETLNEIYRVLTAGGQAYITFNTREFWNSPYKESTFTQLKSEGDQENIPHTYLGEEMLTAGGQAYITFNTREFWNSPYKESTFTQLKSEGDQENIPHTYLGEEILAEMIEEIGFKPIIIQKIFNYFKNGRASKGCHFYALLEKE